MNNDRFRFAASILHTCSLLAMEGSAFSRINVTVLPIEEKIVRIAVLAIILMVGLGLNLFVVLYTIFHPNSWKQSS